MMFEVRITNGERVKIERVLTAKSQKHAEEIVKSFISTDWKVL